MKLTITIDVTDVYNHGALKTALQNDINRLTLLCLNATRRNLPDIASDFYRDASFLETILAQLEVANRIPLWR